MIFKTPEIIFYVGLYLDRASLQLNGTPTQYTKCSVIHFFVFHIIHIYTNTIYSYIYSIRSSKTFKCTVLASIISTAEQDAHSIRNHARAGFANGPDFSGPICLIIKRNLTVHTKAFPLRQRLGPNKSNAQLVKKPSHQTLSRDESRSD